MDTGPLSTLADNWSCAEGLVICL
ncbi:rCG52249 [Rattus norvegicus]|uniref:RCG52249 n=1 Tax=Rattus norvegicus TaxID=10116 RepID=A6K6P3_RAT|nr:rCG52249 [Rattus norvegicus]